VRAALTGLTTVPDEGNFLRPLETR